MLFRSAESERTTRINNRKSIVLVKAVRAGEKLVRTSLAIKRPGFGIPPKSLEEVIGRVTVRDMKADELLTWKDLK